MSDVNFTIGGTAAPFLSAMEQVKANAKESAAKVSESFGIEGVKGERALHTSFTNAFKDITKNGTTSAEAVGGAFESMTEGLRLNLGTMAALIAVSVLVKGLYAGYEAGEKMEKSVKDALSIDSDVTNQSVDKVAENVKKLKEDAEANNLASMSSMTAGAEVLIQAFEEGKSISAVVREDAENYNKLKKEAHDMEDAEGAKTIQNSNAVLQLKVDGHDKDAEALEHEQEMQAKLLDAQEKKNQVTIDALHQEMALEDQLAAKERNKAQDAKDQQLEDLRMQVAEEQHNRGGDSDKLAWAKDKTQHDKTEFAHAMTQGTDPIAIEKARLQWEKSITAEQNVQKEINDKKLKAFEKGNETAAEQSKKQIEAAKKALELAERKKDLLKEQTDAQATLNSAAVDATLFHGEASSLAKSGLGGRVSGANYGTGAQLKAAQDAAKHLADIKQQIAKLGSNISTSG